MSLLWIDGFSHYGASGTKLFTTGTGAYNTINNDLENKTLTMPVLGGIAMSLYATGGQGFALIKDIGAHSSGSLGVGHHFYFTTTDNFHDFLVFQSGAGATLYKTRFNQTTGKVTILDGANTILATSSGSLAAATLYHIETKIVIAGSLGGSIDVRVNSVSFVSVSGITTNATAIQSIAFDQRVSGSTGCVFNLANLYVWDSVGSINNNWLGEQKVYTLFPSADTADADWTKSTGSNGYDLINDVPAVDATRYLDAATVGDVSIFDLTDLPTTALTVAGVLTAVRAEKTDAGGGTLDFGVVHGGVPSLGSVAQVNSLYKYSAKISELNPSTSAVWLSTEINAAQIELSRTV